MNSLFDGKDCTKCGAWRPLDEFRKCPGKKDGRASRCKPCMKQHDQQWRNDNRTMLVERQRAYEERHRERVRARHRETMRAYRKSGKGKEDVKRWKQKNPGKVRVQAVIDPHRRRARKRASGGSFSRKEWLALCEYYGSICLCCGQATVLTVDHVVPLSKGGRNDITNIQPLCSDCNNKKGATAIDYRDPTKLAAFLASLGR